MRPSAVITLRIPYGETATPLFATDAKARVISINRTSLVPSTMDGKTEMGVLIPKRRAMSAMVEKPSCAPIFALIVLIDREKASRRVTGPRLVRVEFRGDHPPTFPGLSTIVSVGFMPDSSAVR